MTIPVSTRRNDYIGNGSVNTYAYGFKIFANTGLRVIVRNTDDVETSLVLTTDFTVTGAGDSGGGNIVLVSSGQAWLTGGNLTTGYTLTILGIEPLDQDTDIRNQGVFFPEVHEDTFDHIVMILQQQQNQLDGCVRLPDTIDPGDVSTVLPIPEALKSIRWDATGTAFENFTPGAAGDIMFPGGTGILAYDGSLNLIVRTITAGSGITITNGSGVSGNPTVTLSDGAVTAAKMAYSSVNGQTAETAPAVTDAILLDDVSAAALRKMTLQNMFKVINGLTADASPDSAADYFLSYDTSAGDVKKVLPGSITRPAGSNVQVVNIQTGVTASGTTTIPLDDTIPQITEGTEFMTLAITPTSATNKLKIDVVFIFTPSASLNVLAALFQDSTANALAGAAQSTTSGLMMTITFTHYMTAGTTSATTFRVRAGGDVAGTVYFNGNSSGRRYGGVMASSITITEIKV